MCTFADMQGIEACADPSLLTLDNYQQLRAGRPTVHGSHLPAAVLMSPPHAARTVVMVRHPLDAMESMFRMLRAVVGPGGAPSYTQLYHGHFERQGTGWAHFVLDWYVWPAVDWLVIVIGCCAGGGSSSSIPTR